MNIYKVYHDEPYVDTITGYVCSALNEENAKTLIYNDEDYKYFDWVKNKENVKVIKIGVSDIETEQIFICSTRES